MNECTKQGCTKEVAVVKRGLCMSHYQVWARSERPRNGFKPCTVEGCERVLEAKGYCHAHYERFKRTGNPLGVREGYVPVPCPEHPHRMLNSRGNCSACYNRDAYWTGPKNGPRLDKRKDVVGYEAMHYRLRIDRGRAAEYDCTDCPGQATDWSLKHDAENLRAAVSGRAIGALYSLDPMDYEPRCSACHKAYDAIHQNKKERRAYGTYFRDQREAWQRKKAA